MKRYSRLLAPASRESVHLVEAVSGVIDPHDTARSSASNRSNTTE